MAQILFRPICSNCKKQLFDVIDFEYDLHRIEGEGAGILHCRTGHVEPARCPYCKEWFESIEMPNSLPFPNYMENNALED